MGAVRLFVKAIKNFWGVIKKMLIVQIREFVCYKEWENERIYESVFQCVGHIERMENSWITKNRY